MKKNTFTIKELSELLDISFFGDSEKQISGASNPENAQNNQIAFLFEKKYLDKINTSNAGCFLVDKNFSIDNNRNFLVSDKPKISMAKILELFAYKSDSINGIHSSSHISDNVKIGENSQIYPFVYLGKNVKIGNNTTVMSGTSIGDNSVIEDNVYIYPNVSIMENTLIGKEVIIHSGTVIGSDGYGFIQLENNYHYKIPQIGNVIIESEVEIGSNVSIDRGTVGSTVIGEGTKIDNHVHIGHNVKIGKRCLIVAQVGIAGSTTIGDNVIIAGQSGISGHLQIGNNTLILSRSGVTKNFPDNSKISGFPARNHIEELKNQALVNKIPDLIKEIEELKKLIK